MYANTTPKAPAPVWREIQTPKLLRRYTRRHTTYSLLWRGQLDQKLDVVRLNLCGIGRAAANYLAAFLAAVDYHIAFLWIGHNLNRTQQP